MIGRLFLSFVILLMSISTTMSEHFFHLKFGILEFLISKVYLYCLLMLLHLAFALCAPQVPFVCLYGYGRVLHGGLAIRGGGGEPWVQKGLWLMECLRPNVHFIILIFCNLFINS